MGCSASKFGDGDQVSTNIWLCSVCHHDPNIFNMCSLLFVELKNNWKTINSRKQLEAKQCLFTTLKLPSTFYLLKKDLS